RVGVCRDQTGGAASYGQGGGRPGGHHEACGRGSLYSRSGLTVSGTRQGYQNAVQRPPFYCGVVLVENEGLTTYAVYSSGSPRQREPQEAGSPAFSRPDRLGQVEASTPSSYAPQSLEGGVRFADHLVGGRRDRSESYGNWHGEMVQRGEGLRLHLASRGARRVRALLVHPDGRVQVARGGAARRVRRRTRKEGRGSPERPRRLIRPLAQPASAYSCS